MQKALNHFKKVDPILFSYAKKIKLTKQITKDKPNNYFSRLCREIICQQLSGASGGAIHGRFLKLYQGKIIPKNVLSTDHQMLRNTGMSNAKAKYVKNLAEAFVTQTINPEELDKFGNEQVIEQLVKVKGIGRWTAEMFLMFVLARENIFSYGDLGLRKGFIKVYNLKSFPEQSQAEKIINKWSPYKTYASLVLWQAME
jgi:DNA-3-methyladenine glycosylase II